MIRLFFLFPFISAIVFLKVLVILSVQLQETEGEGEDEGEDEIDDEVEEEGENESGAAAAGTETPSKPDVVLPPVFREPERQLSKKEIKKKELAALEAVIAEFRVDQTEEKEENGESFYLLLN